MKYLFEIAYKGTNYHGWQRQKNAMTVQQMVEEAFSKIMRTEISILGSGRTDTGVHCEQQFFHIETESEIPDADRLLFKINNYLPEDIAIKNAALVSDNAHARFSAFSRSYEYRMTLVKDPFNAPLRYFFNRPLDIKTMNEAAALLIGKQDFECFSRVKTEVNNFFCDITEAKWVLEGDNLTFYISANRFLRGMVRAIVGTLLKVGLGKITVNQFQEIIDSKDRKNAGAAAPAQGLFLTKVVYPQDIFIN
ncbi:tRNA pseudouridine(38-40) synthase TruA [Fulvivirga lutimaris]|uniref:tRNA pseudouridine(38-40) synthase TruA n=1 Tax=Fulvivirga lutimaris TaxID=1819566 RepID=UPI0012BBBA08|nr:tRNA pseudouridine(38-40) synthase TruA [Fulvivirga lutimaris]MTI41612.1 tRNA pseudouridine(38-40) synthase TruA [Fulvivirga lutimaris]